MTGKSFKDRLTELLIAHKLISRDKLSEALKIQNKQGGSLGAILTRNGFINEKDLVIVISEELKIPPVDLSNYKLDPKIVKIIPERIARQYMVTPVSKFKNTLMVAMTDPMNIFAIDDLKTMTGFNIEPVISTEKDIKEALDNCYSAETPKITEILEEVDVDTTSMEEVKEEHIDIDKAAEESGTAPIIKMVDLIIREGLIRRASDIHIEPEEKGIKVRYRVDGELQEGPVIPKKNQNAIITRLKIMSGIDITESRIPQDGRFKVRMAQKEIDFRVSLLPIIFGQKIVLRALDKSNLSVGLQKLGYLPEPLRAFEEAVKKPYGMILVTGPTGSGKSTTLYSVITEINHPDKNIITVEDPVEYQIEGITQVAARPEIGLTFASGLRSILRQTPDVIMVGEIRDAETADIAVKASLTGHLVLSTLHTNDAASAITRLIDMGVEPFLIASSVIIIAAQRLCRRICSNCKEAYDIPKETLREVGVDVDKLHRGQVFYRGKGCKKCNNTGYYGRLGTIEALVPDDTIREMIIEGASSYEIKEYAVKNGMTTLRENALTKFLKGITSLEEVLRVTSEE